MQVFYRFQRQSAQSVSCQETRSEERDSALGKCLIAIAKMVLDSRIILRHCIQLPIFANWLKQRVRMDVILGVDDEYKEIFPLGCILAAMHVSDLIASSEHAKHANFVDVLSVPVFNEAVYLPYAVGSYLNNIKNLPPFLKIEDMTRSAMLDAYMYVRHSTQRDLS